MNVIFHRFRLFFFFLKTSEFLPFSQYEMLDEKTQMSKKLHALAQSDFLSVLYMIENKHAIHHTRIFIKSAFPREYKYDINNKIMVENMTYQLRLIYTN